MEYYRNERTIYVNVCTSPCLTFFGECAREKQRIRVTKMQMTFRHFAVAVQNYKAAASSTSYMLQFQPRNSMDFRVDHTNSMAWLLSYFYFCLCNFAFSLSPTLAFALIPHLALPFQVKWSRIKLQSPRSINNILTKDVWCLSRHSSNI